MVLGEIPFAFDETVWQSLTAQREERRRKNFRGILEVEQLYDYEKHYMAKRTTSCNWPGVLVLTSARCRNVCTSVNVMANTLTALEHEAYTMWDEAAIKSSASYLLASDVPI